MTTTLYLAQHDAFIVWFDRNYPQLCKMYCMDILPAIDDTGFVFKWENMDKEMVSVILQITNDYYYLIRQH